MRERERERERFSVKCHSALGKGADFRTNLYSCNYAYIWTN